MNMINSIILEGIMHDVSVKDTPHRRLASFNLEVIRKYERADGIKVDETSTFVVECWGKLAQHVTPDLIEGRGVRVVGRLKQNRWEDTNGEKHSSIVIVAEHAELKPMLSGHSQVEG